MINRQIETPEQLKAMWAAVGSRIELHYERKSPDYWRVRVTYRKQTVEFDSVCLESGFPEPNPARSVSWLHTMCMDVMRKDLETFTKSWWYTPEQGRKIYDSRRQLAEQVKAMFGVGFLTTWYLSEQKHE